MTLQPNDRWNPTIDTTLLNAVSYTPGVSVNFEACNALVKGTLARPKPCAPLENLLQNTQCSFNGVWQGARTGVAGVTSRNYMLLSAFWYKVGVE